MQALTTLSLAVLMTGWGMVGPVSAQAAPNFPSMDAVLEARAPLVRRDLQAKIDALEAQLFGKSRFQRLLLEQVIDRIELTASYGRGLTLLNKTDNGAGVVTDTTSDQSKFSWGITYTIGLKELTRNRSSRAALRRALALARAERDEAVVADRVAMVEKLNGYLEARAAFEESTGATVLAAEGPGTDVDLKAGYRMRRLALEILVLVDKDRGPLFAEWDRFQPEKTQPAATAVARR